jgi:ElaB/YqjD/DUF883 family membrane-anchored ribosome-binding protein
METSFENIRESHRELAREKLLDDLKSLAGDAQSLLEATAHDVSAKATEARSRLAVTLERAKATCVDWEERALDATKIAAEKADQTIRQHPYESIGVAFGVGLLIGVLVSRR